MLVCSEERLLGQHLHEGLGGGSREREGEVGDVEGEDVGPRGDEVELVERVHFGRLETQRVRTGRWTEFKQREGSFRRVRGLHCCIACLAF